MKKAIVIIFAIIALGSAGYLAYNYFNNSKEAGDNGSNVDDKKRYVLNKITDYMDNGIEFYDEFKDYGDGYLFSYRTKNNENRVVFFDKDGKDITNTIYSFDTGSNLYFREIADDIFKLTGNVNGKERNVIFNSDFELLFDNEKYVVESSANKKYLIVHDEDKKLYGLYDLNGKEIIGMSYEYLYQPYGANYLFAEKDGKGGIIDFNNKVLVPFEYDKYLSRGVYFTAFTIGRNNENVLILKNGVPRVIDTKGKEIINIDSDFNDSNPVSIGYDSKQNFYYVCHTVLVSSKIDLLKIYDDSGKFIKDINIDGGYRLRKNIYKDKSDTISYLTFVDKDNVSYKLNSNYELEKVGKLYCRPDTATGSDLNCFYGGNITVKVNNNGKYEVYNAAGTSKLVNQEFELLEFKDKYAYGCLEKVDDLSGNNCGYFDYSGKVLFDFKYDGKSFDKIFELHDGSLYAASMEKIFDKTGTLDKYDYFMPIKDLIVVDTRVDNKNKRTLYNLEGEVVLDNIYNVDGIMNDKLVSIEYYDKNSGYNTEIYSIDDMKTPLLNDIQLIKKFYHKDKAYYYASDGIYELTEK